MSGPSKLLWLDQGIQKDVQLCRYLPFILHMQSGSLPESVYNEYARDDAHFLSHHCSLNQRVAALCSDDSSTKHLVSFFEEQVAFTEKEIKENYGKLSLRGRPSDAALEYMHFLDEIVPLSVAVTKMLPCAQLYEYLGEQISLVIRLHDVKLSQAVKAWVDMYSSTEYALFVRKLEDVCDSLIKDGFNEEKEMYQQAMRLEYAFFDAHSSSLPSLPTLVPRDAFVCIDFDKTITERDTCDALPRTRFEALDGEDRWKQAEVEYMSAYETFMEQNIDCDLLSFLDAYDRFETSMVMPVEESGLLKGITDQMIIDSVKQQGIRCRPGVKQFTDLMQRVCISPSIISSNWSERLIRETIASLQCDQVIIFANKLQVDDDGVTTGLIEKSVSCGGDKTKMIDKLVGDRDDPFIVFIGDSTNDLCALLRADIGIILPPASSGSISSSLSSVCERFHIALLPLAASLSSSPPCLSAGFRLYVARSWTEVHEWGCVALGVQNAPSVLVIAGSDSGAGAGIQADIKACEAVGVYASTAISAITVQDTVAVHRCWPSPPDLLCQQIECTVADMSPRAIKTGMLFSADTIALVAASVRASRLSLSHRLWLVVDPVLCASSGSSLVRTSDTLHAYCSTLLPLADLVTPNLPEAQALLGRTASITSADEMKQAARDVADVSGVRWVLLKGGHLPLHSHLVDLLFDARSGSFCEFTHRRVASANVHGTGCSLASAITAHLALGHSMKESVAKGIAYVQRCLERSRCMAIGRGACGPMKHSSIGIRWKRSLPLDLRVYVVTDQSLIERLSLPIEEAVRQAIEGGATIVQYRRKHGETRELIEEATRVGRVCEQFSVPFVINDRVDVAQIVPCDGVHVGQDDCPVRVARDLLPSSSIIGVSARSVAEAVQGEQDGADYIGAGAVYTTATKDSAPIGETLLQQICEAVSIPVVAIGGVHQHNAEHIIKMGCAGAAVVSAVFGGQDVSERTSSLRVSIDTALAVADLEL